VRTQYNEAQRSTTQRSINEAINAAQRTIAEPYTNGNTDAAQRYNNAAQ
jgi:hypothetical protein